MHDFHDVGDTDIQETNYCKESNKLLTNKQTKENPKALENAAERYETMKQNCYQENPWFWKMKEKGKFLTSMSHKQEMPWEVVLHTQSCIQRQYQYCVKGAAKKCTNCYRSNLFFKTLFSLNQIQLM